MFLKISIILILSTIFACSPTEPPKVETKPKVKKDTLERERLEFDRRMKKIRDRKRAKLLEKRGNIAKQREEAEQNRLVTLQNNSVAMSEHYSSRAKTFFKEGEYDDAYKYAKKAYSLDKTNVDAIKLLKDTRQIRSAIRRMGRVKKTYKKRK